MKVQKATRSKRIRDNLVMLRDGSFAMVLNNTPPYFAHPVNTTVYQADMGFRLPWHITLLFNYEGIDAQKIVTIEEEDITGKGLVCGNILSGHYQEWFMSKRDT